MSASDIAIVGLGTMGAALALNIADSGFSVSVFNRTRARTGALVDNAGALAGKLTPASTLAELVRALKTPRAVLLMVPAGAPVDEQIDALLPLLSDGDLIIDGGNSVFRDTERRSEAVRRSGKRYMGLGVSGGEDGARHGPSMMAGALPEAWDQVAPILTAIAAKFGDAPCAARLGTGGAGHFVKMVHNGIEYADMQMIAEAYGVMRDGMGASPAQMAATFARWNDGALQSYLTEITAEILKADDPETGAPMIDMIVDRAAQKGTGRWTVIEAQELGTPISVIEAAVMARNLSARQAERQRAAEHFNGAEIALPTGAITIDDIESALIAGKIVCYAQGFSMLADGAGAHEWNMSLPEVAGVWRAGCIIRSAMLDDMATALGDAPGGNLLLAPHFSPVVAQHEPALRKLICVTSQHGLPVPALSAARNYLDMLTIRRSTANMIQAQRDFFGAHGFERTDRDGDHHGPW